MNAWHVLLGSDYIGHMVGSVNGVIAVGFNDQIGKGDSIDLLGFCGECRGSGEGDSDWPCVNCQGIKGFHRAYGQVGRVYRVYDENTVVPDSPHFVVRGEDSEVFHISTHRIDLQTGTLYTDLRERRINLPGVIVGGMALYISHVTAYDEDDQRPALDIDPKMLLETINV